MANILEKWMLGTTTTLLSTELNSLATSSGLTAGAISSVGGTSGVFDNTATTGAFDGYTLGKYELNLAAPAGTLTVNTAAYVWFLSQLDGTNFEDGSASIIPARKADLTFPVRAASTAQRLFGPVFGVLPPGTWKVLIAQNTGQAWGATGNTLKVQPITRQGVY